MLFYEFGEKYFLLGIILLNKFVIFYYLFDRAIISKKSFYLDSFDSLSKQLLTTIIPYFYSAHIAPTVEQFHGKEEVIGSNPFVSTIPPSSSFVFFNKSYFYGIFLFIFL